MSVFPIADLDTSARMIEETCAELEDAIADVADEDMVAALHIYQSLTRSGTALTAAKKALATKIGRGLGPEARQIEGIGRVKRHADVSRTQWDSDALLRMVLDSRVADPETGEFKDETPIDKVRAVWGLKGYQAKVGAIRDRGLDPDEFCASEFRGWSLEVRG